MWYVGFLLLYSEEIRSNPDPECDSYNDLLVVEKELHTFQKLGLISEQEQSVLDVIIQNSRFDSTGLLLNIDRRTVADAFFSLCKKLSMSLGGVFTDAGFVDYMQNKYNLTDEQVNKMQNYIKSNLKFKLLREPFDKEKNELTR